MLTIIPKGLRIIADGCRYILNDGRIVEKYCNECNAEGKSCELESCARKLAGIPTRKGSLLSLRTVKPRFNR